MDVISTPSATDGRGLTPLSYWAYLHAIVTRFRTSSALGMWEPVSEPEASTCPSQYQPLDCQGHQTCPDEAVAAQALRHFFEVVGAEIHALDPNHLVEEGTVGGGQCGTAGADYRYVSASPGINVLSYHDYYSGPELLGRDWWNGLDVRLAQADGIGKPIIGGEMGVDAGRGAGCTGLGRRAREITARSRLKWQAEAAESCCGTGCPRRHRSAATTLFQATRCLRARNRLTSSTQRSSWHLATVTDAGLAGLSP